MKWYPVKILFRIISDDESHTAQFDFTRLIQKKAKNIQSFEAIKLLQLI